MIPSVPRKRWLSWQKNNSERGIFCISFKYFQALPRRLNEPALYQNLIIFTIYNVAAVAAVVAVATVVVVAAVAIKYKVEWISFVKTE